MSTLSEEATLAFSFCLPSQLGSTLKETCLQLAEQFLQEYAPFGKVLFPKEVQKVSSFVRMAK